MNYCTVKNKNYRIFRGIYFIDGLAADTYIATHNFSNFSFYYCCTHVIYIYFFLCTQTFIKIKQINGLVDLSSANQGRSRFEWFLLYALPYNTRWNAMIDRLARICYCLCSCKYRCLISIVSLTLDDSNI